MLPALSTAMPSFPPPSSLRETLPDGTLLIAGPNLRLRVAVLRPGVVLVSAQGEVKHPDDVSAELTLLRELEAELDHAHQLTLFADLRESERMPSTSRDRLATWARRHEARPFKAHVLVRSTLLEMAISIISMLVGTSRVEMHVRAPAFWALVKESAPDSTKYQRFIWKKP
jgi:hypothetical protein